MPLSHYIKFKILFHLAHMYGFILLNSFTNLKSFLYSKWFIYVRYI